MNRMVKSIWSPTLGRIQQAEDFREHLQSPASRDRQEFNWRNDTTPGVFPTASLIRPISHGVEPEDLSLCASQIARIIELLIPELQVAIEMIKTTARQVNDMMRE